MRYCVFVLILIFSIQAQGQKVNICEGSWSESYIITSINGLNFRDKPTNDGKVLATIPYEAVVQIGENCGLFPETIKGVKGKWRKGFYKGEIGFVFDPYIERLLDESEFHGFYGIQESSYSAIEVADDESFYGLYRKEEPRGGNNEYFFKQIDLKGILDQKKQSQSLIFVINDPRYLDNTIVGREINRMLYPGDQVLTYIPNSDQLPSKKNYYTIYAKGEIEKGSQLLPAIKAIRNYELRLVTPEGKDQLLFKTDIRSWSHGDYENKIYVYWVGDLNHDHKLDLLIGYNFTYKGGYHKLYLSSDNTRVKGHYIEIDMGGWGE